MKTVDQMASEVLEWFNDVPRSSQINFQDESASNLIMYHTTLGRDIRNHFKLWERTWTPELINGIDHSDDHPHVISMDVIHAVWKRIQLVDIQ